MKTLSEFALYVKYGDENLVIVSLYVNDVLVIETNSKKKRQKSLR